MYITRRAVAADAWNQAIRTARTWRGAREAVRQVLAAKFPELSEEDREILIRATRPGLSRVIPLPAHLEE